MKVLGRRLRPKFGPKVIVDLCSVFHGRRRYAKTGLTRRQSQRPWLSRRVLPHESPNETTESNSSRGTRRASHGRGSSVTLGNTRKMNPTLEDIERAIQHGSIEKADRATLEAYARVVPRTGGNPAFHLRVEQVQRRVDLALKKLDDAEREAREIERHAKATRLAGSANHIAKWAIVIAIAALTVSVVQTFWR